MAKARGLFQVNLPRIDWHPELFDQLINDRGVRISWEKATMCPCVRADATSGTPSFNCGTCYNGSVYIDLIELKGTATNLTSQRNAQIYGDLVTGGVFLTVPGEYRLGVNDRIRMLDQTSRFSEQCVMATCTVRTAVSPGDTTIAVDNTRRFAVPSTELGYATVLVDGQELRYTGKTATTLTGIPADGVGAVLTPIAVSTTIQALEFLLKYEPVTIFDARTIDGALYEDTDFIMIEGRRVRFLPGSVPDRWTTLYDARPTYLVDSLAHEYRDQHQLLGVEVGAESLMRLPVAAVLRRDIISRQG